MFKRVFLPFILVQVSMVFVYCFLSGNYIPPRGWVRNFGYGPGSYYPLLYIQMALLLQLFKKSIQRLSRLQLLLIFLCLSEGSEILCSLTNPPEWLYRLLILRYFFIIYLGYLWVKEGVILNTKMIILSCLSAFAVIYFSYYSVDDEPWFFTTAWNISRWPCYYWVSNGLICIFWYIWKYLKRVGLINNCVQFLSRTTWEIYLMQMASIFLIKDKMLPIDNIMLRFAVWVMIIWIISIGGGYLLNRFFINTIYAPKNIKQ